MSDNPLTACFRMFLSLSQPNFMDILYYSVVSHTEKYTETRTSAGTHSLFYYCLSVCLFFLSACLSLSLSLSLLDSVVEFGVIVVIHRYINVI